MNLPYIKEDKVQSINETIIGPIELLYVDNINNLNYCKNIDMTGQFIIIYLLFVFSIGLSMIFIKKCFEINIYISTEPVILIETIISSAYCIYLINSEYMVSFLKNKKNKTNKISSYCEKNIKNENYSTAIIGPIEMVCDLCIRDCKDYLLTSLTTENRVHAQFFAIYFSVFILNQCIARIYIKLLEYFIYNFNNLNTFIVTLLLATYGVHMLNDEYMKKYLKRKTPFDIKNLNI